MKYSGFTKVEEFDLESHNKRPEKTKAERLREARLERERLEHERIEHVKAVHREDLNLLVEETSSL